MVSFKSFVTAIQAAITQAGSTLMDKNTELIDKYFIQAPDNVKGAANAPGKTALTPKTVLLQYPDASTGEVTEIHVPLLTLVPLTMPKIEKATITADFEMQIVEGELQLNFPSRSGTAMFKKKPKMSRGTLEIVFSPQEMPEGFKLVVEGYESILKRQIS